MLDEVDRQIADLMAARERMHDTLASWDATLAGTPEGRPARLLESLRIPTHPTSTPVDELRRRR